MLPLYVILHILQKNEIIRSANMTKGEIDAWG